MMKLIKSMGWAILATWLSVVAIVLGWQIGRLFVLLIVKIFETGHASLIFASIAIVGLFIGFTGYIYKESE